MLGPVHDRHTKSIRLFHGARGGEGLGLRIWAQTWHVRQSTAAGVRTKTAARGQERETQGMSEGGIDAGETRGREPPRRLSGGECCWQLAIDRECRRSFNAVVRSTLQKARAEAQTLQDGEVRKPATSQARTGEADVERHVGTKGVSGSEGNAKTGAAGSASGLVRSGAADGFDSQWALRRRCRAMIVITDTLTGAIAAGTVTGTGWRLTSWSAAS